ncbi:phosphotransferase family protein [Nocardioides taihuensis]|uniref:Phosphotransferase family protein n=1 Tax=Nocardioides taihuensis TaxID=1835606 RepID=A0ABW0BJK4_9ACTN
MLERPDHTSDDEVLAAVRDHWAPAAASVTHLAVGFGAHHWRVDDLFVTLDEPSPKHTAATLEAAYATAAVLRAQGLELVLAPLPTTTGVFTHPLAAGWLSVTPWVDAPRAAAPADAALLAPLHAAPPSPGLRTWRPLVGPGLADDLARRLREPWVAGPHGEAARSALREHLDDVARWVADYHRLAAATDPATWVTTHGEPHERNLLAGPDGPLLVDWETVMLAPRERDLRQCGLPGDPDLLRMFDLEWRLDEISQYAAWFEQPHGDGEDDRVSLGGLRHELTRPDPTATDAIV